MAIDITGYASNYQDANTPAFQNQILIAMMTYASTVITEQSTVTNHAVRLDLVTEVFKNPAQYTYNFALLAVANGAVYQTTTDAQLLTLIGTIWTALCTGSNPAI